MAPVQVAVAGPARVRGRRACAPTSPPAAGGLAARPCPAQSRRGHAQPRRASARLRLLEQAEALFLSEMPIIPVYWYTTNYLLHDAVQGWHPLLLNNHPYKFVDLELPQN